MGKNAAAAAPSSAAAEEQRGVVEEVKYKGVRKRKWGKYVSEIRLPNSRDRIWLGSYDTAEKAARAFDAALFCLRGPTAKFNFPLDPPDVAGWQSLTPAEIQAVAQHYGNTDITNHQHPPPPSAELEGASPSSNSEGAGPMDSAIDWSFLDVLDSDRAGNAGHVSDFGLFHEPGDMYMTSHLGNDDDDDDHDHENDGVNNAQPSFLWNF